jgi:putative two-component system response regulator
MPDCARILLVDDEERVLFVLSNALKKLGNRFEIVTARDGAQALDYARQLPFNLLITDLHMPLMDGVELTRAVKALCPETAVIWITAYGSYVRRAEAERLGVAYYLDKPLEIGEIRLRAVQALEGIEPGPTS